MHPASAFRQRDAASLAALVAERGFALIVGASDGRPMAAHAPVLLAEGRLRFHLSGANPLTAALLAGSRALAVVTGPDAYVSPDWYAAADQVPTWNYLSAEIEGPVRPLDHAETTRLLDDLSAHFEAPLAPKPPWTRAKMTPARFEALLGAINGFEMRVERLEGVTKLSQNKPAEIERVAKALAERPDAGSQAIARLMSNAQKT
ncbi:MAG TPA: FMN-binding negative transcriptional regulator [Caulobacteraceae bacterium]|nr:FMN-binding negative transcriptional regulator [Caulobacteraceae bacterium]